MISCAIKRPFRNYFTAASAAIMSYRNDICGSSCSSNVYIDNDSTNDPHIYITDNKVVNTDNQMSASTAATEVLTS